MKFQILCVETVQPKPYSFLFRPAGQDVNVDLSDCEERAGVKLVVLQYVVLNPVLKQRLQKKKKKFREV